MKISYNWLKWYIPDAPEADKLADIITYHLAEVETVEEKGDDKIFDIKILPNRAHDLLSHQGIAREISSLLNIKFVDPTPKYKVPESKPTNLQINIPTGNAKQYTARRYIGRIVRNVEVRSGPDWIKNHLESIGERSINNLVDATNITMFDCGEPTHIFDFDKIKGAVSVREAKKGEKITLLDGKEIILDNKDIVIADSEGPLALAGIKGGKRAEVDQKTTNILIEVANFFPYQTRKTSTRTGVRTQGSKRWENSLSPELAAYGMKELSALIAEVCPEAIFEEIVDIYPEVWKQERLTFSVSRISKILGLEISALQVEDILKRYVYKYVYEKGVFEIIVPPMRLDLVIEEDMAEEIGRILGYDKVKPKIPKIDFEPKPNEVHAKILFARNKLLSEGYSEVMTSTFRNNGEVSVLASASDKTFLRTNLSDGLNESLKLNQLNAPLLGLEQIKIFEIGTVFKKNGEEMHVCYGDKKEIKEISLEEFVQPLQKNFVVPPASGFPHKQNFSAAAFQAWSPFPFIARDVAVWVPDTVESSKVHKVIKENAGELLIKGPDLFDEFKKDGKNSYAFRLVFQSPDRTLTDVEVNEIMTKITNKIKDNNGWQVR